MASGWYTGGYRGGYRGQGYVPGYPPNTGLTPATTNLALWLEADFGVTASSNLATGWVDQSPNVNSASASGAGRPTLTANAINGLPVMTFDGAATSMLGASNVVAAGADRTLILIAKHTASVNSGGVYFQFKRGNPCEWAAMGLSGSGYVTGDGVAQNAILHPGNSWAASAFHFIQLTRTSNTVALWVDGVSWALDNATGLASDTGTAGYLIGNFNATQYFTGQIPLILAYSGVISAGDLATNKTYARSKYGLTIS